MTKITLRPHEEFTNFYVEFLEQRGFIFNRKIKRNLPDDQITLKYTTETDPVAIIDTSLDELKIKSRRKGIDTYAGSWLLWGKQSKGLWHMIIDTAKQELTFQFTLAYHPSY